MFPKNWGKRTLRGKPWSDPPGAQLRNELVGQPFQADVAGLAPWKLGNVRQAGKPDLRWRCRAPARARPGGPFLALTGRGRLLFSRTLSFADFACRPSAAARAGAGNGRQTSRGSIRGPSGPPFV